MSKVILTTISDDRFHRKNGLYGITQKKIEYIFEHNPEFGIDDYVTLTWDDVLRSDFYQENKALLDNPDASKNNRAYKCWAIQTALNEVEDGDFIVYTDSSPELFPMEEDYKIPENYDLNIIKNLCDQNGGILTAFVKWDTRHIKHGLLGIHTHENFTTDRCMRVMGLECYAKSFMGASGMIVIKKTKDTSSIINEWLYWCCNDQTSLGKKEDHNDYSYWNEEEGHKSGSRSDQSVLGLLLCRDGYKLVDPPNQIELNPYNFLNYCRIGVEYKFIDPNNVPYEEPRIRKGSRVRNQAGHELTVYEVWPEDGKEVYYVGNCRESLYKTTEDQLTLI